MGSRWILFRVETEPERMRSGILPERAGLQTMAWIAVEEFKLSYHNGYM